MTPTNPPAEPEALTDFNRYLVVRGHIPLTVAQLLAWEDFERARTPPTTGAGGEEHCPLSTPPDAAGDRGGDAGLSAGGETGWLMERCDQWYAPAHSDWTLKTAVDPELWRENWTSDPNAALRFARKQDAETMIRMGGWRNTVATEHLWRAARSAATASPAEVGLREALSATANALHNAATELNANGSLNADDYARQAVEAFAALAKPDAQASEGES